MSVHLPHKLLNSLVGIKGFDKKAFVQVHESKEQVTSIRVNPFKSSIVNGEWSIFTHHSSLTTCYNIPWCDTGFYLGPRPSFTFDPLFHAGCYYVQEASSMFLEQVLKQTVDLLQPLKVLDLCAAPGGKSTHILSLISKDSLLVSNEVIRMRANILNDNTTKWGCGNVMVTNNDPKDFQRVENYFDVIVIDAPCSGSGLFRRDPEAIEEWSEQNVTLCCQRQQRILADVLPALKDNGILIYSTCSYSKEEDEEIAEWIKRQLILSNEELIIDPAWSITKTDGGYRFWPDKIKGEGFFISCFRKQADNNREIALPKLKAEKFSKQETEVLNKYVNDDKITYTRNGKIIHAVPGQLLAHIDFLSTKLRVVDHGIKVGEIIRDKLIPGHSLAMSNILNSEIRGIELNYEQAIQFLKKKDLVIDTDKKGWSLVSYHGHALGWVNILPNRINNYYPKELRILKD